MFKFAENLLNNLDQTTQSTVQTVRSKDNKNAKSGSNNKQSKHSKNKSLTTGQNLHTISDHTVTSLSASNSSLNLTSNKTIDEISKSVGLSSKSSKKDQDEDLFENFLNNPEKPEVALSIKSASVNSLNEGAVQFTVGDKSGKPSDNEESLSESIEINEDTNESNIRNVNTSSKHEKEIALLNEEIQSLMRQIKTSQNDYQRARRKLESFQNQNIESEKIIRELRSREEDMTETVKSKDSQLSVLRVRYTELEVELASKSREIESIRFESERILKDHSNNSDAQSQAFETLKEKVKDLEYSLDKEKDKNSQLQKEYMSMQNRLEHENQTLNESISLMEKKLNDEKIKNLEMSGQVKNAHLKQKTLSTNLKKELDEYKLKATKTLQAKDMIIAQLKESKIVEIGSEGDEGSGEGKSETTSLSLIEIQELKAERDYLKDELESKIANIDMLKSELSDLETETSTEIEILKDENRSLTSEQEQQRQTKEYLEQDLRSLREQLDYAQEELYKQKSTTSTRLAERETEIERLRSQLTTKSLGSTTEKELENRLHLLTENLIQKQTLIEALQSEKHSIFLQLERSEKRLDDYEKIFASKANSGSVSIRMGHGGDEEMLLPNSKEPIFRESPYDHEVTKKVKRAATEIDKFSIRLGVFLKKYPIARIFVLFYMFLLHLWVVVVLFTYTPEAHSSSYENLASVLPHHPSD